LKKQFINILPLPVTAAKTITTLLFIFLISGCATNSLTPKPVTKANLNESRGILVGSFSRDPERADYHSQTFFFKNASTGERYTIKSQTKFNLLKGRTTDDFETEDSEGGVFVFSLPAGKYIFYDFYLFLEAGQFSKSWRPKEPFAIPFIVQPSKVNYVGEFKLSQHTGKNFFGMSVLAGGVWLVSDQNQRDISIFSEKYPDIPIENLTKTIPSQKDVFTHLVILPSEREEYNKMLESNETDD
jgi:hypothetical protein